MNRDMTKVKDWKREKLCLGYILGSLVFSWRKTKIRHEICRKAEAVIRLWGPVPPRSTSISILWYIKWTITAFELFVWRCLRVLNFEFVYLSFMASVETEEKTALQSEKQLVSKREKDMHNISTSNSFALYF